MIYRYKFFLELDEHSDYKTSKDIALDEKYNLNIKLDKDKKYNTSSVVLTIRDKYYSKIIEEEFLYSFNSFDFYKTYYLSKKGIKDIFIIKIYSDDILRQLQITDFNNNELENEILFTDYKNEFELMDLSALLITYQISNHAKKLFTDKLLYFGYDSLEEIIGDENVFDVIIGLTQEQKLETFDSIVKNLYQMALVNMNTPDYGIDYIKEKMKFQIKRIEDLRLRNLESCFKL